MDKWDWFNTQHSQLSEFQNHQPVAQKWTNRQQPTSCWWLNQPKSKRLFSSNLIISPRGYLEQKHETKTTSSPHSHIVLTFLPSSKTHFHGRPHVYFSRSLSMITNESNRPVDVWLQIADKIDLWGARCCMAMAFSMTQFEDITGFYQHLNFYEFLRDFLVVIPKSYRKAKYAFRKSDARMDPSHMEETDPELQQFHRLMLPPWSLTASAPLKSDQNKR